MVNVIDLIQYYRNGYKDFPVFDNWDEFAEYMEESGKEYPLDLPNPKPNPILRWVLRQCR